MSNSKRFLKSYTPREGYMKDWDDLLPGSEYLPGHNIVPPGTTLCRKQNMDDGYHCLINGEWSSDDTFPPEGLVFVTKEVTSWAEVEDPTKVGLQMETKFFTEVPMAGLYRFEGLDYENKPYHVDFEIFEVIGNTMHYKDEDEFILVKRNNKFELIDPGAWEYYKTMKMTKLS